jgi:N,N'-diacetyllegionaminate synthase
MGRTIIIAEAGVNHNGSIDIAKNLIDVAVEAGVDYVKFQTFKASKLASQQAVKAEYQSTNAGDGDDSQLNMLKKLELTEADHYELISYCNERGIKFLSTAFDMESLYFLQKLGLKLFKIPSGELTNLPYIQAIASMADQIILSTGMSTIEEVGETVKILRENGRAQITVLHCNTEYPTPFSDVNLLAMVSMRKEFNVETGYSDHTLGIEVPVAAVALGATVIEKHFTLDRNMSGPDHLASLEPEELKSMVHAIRNIEQALGSSDKKPSLSEIKNKAIARKSIHLARDKNAGEILQADDLEMLRPGDGISPMKIAEVTGKKLTKHLTAGHKLTPEDLI